MLTEGYLRGWLSFDSKTPLSSLREEYILNVLERDLLLSASRTKIGVIGSLVGGSLSKNALNTLAKDLKAHFELALPYTAEKSKIGSGTAVQQMHDAAFWRDIIAKKKEEATGPQKEEELIEILPVEIEQ